MANMNPLNWLSPKYDPALFESIHRDTPSYLPPNENEDSIHMILKVAGVITVVHLILLTICKTVSTNDDGKAGRDDAKAKSLAAWKASYQLTNLLVNLTLGCVGIYYQLFHIPLNISTGETIIHKITGYVHVKHFALGQVGYQLWALPIGIFFVGEAPSMLLHHVAVICVGCTSAFVTCGFRYYTPYFYGLIEISSVPLSVLNSFKNNPAWISKYPELYSMVRLIFGVTFLLVRVVFWTPIIWDYFKLALMLLYSSDALETQVVLTIFVLSAFILTMLQYFWASKILSAMLGGSKKKKKAKSV